MTSSSPPLPLQLTSLGRRFTRSHCKGGSGADVGWGSLRSPWWLLLRRSHGNGGDVGGDPPPCWFLLRCSHSRGGGGCGWGEGTLASPAIHQDRKSGA